MFSAHATLLPDIPLPLPDATNTPNSSDAATTSQEEEIDRYVHRYVSLSAYLEKKKKKMFFISLIYCNLLSMLQIYTPKYCIH